MVALDIERAPGETERPIYVRRRRIPQTRMICLPVGDPRSLEAAALESSVVTRLETQHGGAIENCSDGTASGVHRPEKTR